MEVGVGPAEQGVVQQPFLCAGALDGFAGTGHVIHKRTLDHGEKTLFQIPACLGLDVIVQVAFDMFRVCVADGGHLEGIEAGEDLD